MADSAGRDKFMAFVFNQSILRRALVGRDTTLADFDHLLQSAAHGQRQIVLLSGEAGIGKSRLAAEVSARAAGQDFVTLSGQCFPADRATPYALILDLLRTRYTSGGSRQTEMPDNRAVQTLCQLLPGIAPLAAEPVTPLQLEPEIYKQQLFTTLLSFFAHFTEQSPLVVLLEDLHWSDEASLDFLLYLARWSANQPLLLLLTYRTDEDNATLQHWLAQIVRERLTLEFSLTPLKREDVAAMLHETFEQALPVDLVDAVYGLTEGNPFFVEETLKSLLASGAIILVDGVWQYVARQAQWHVPRSIQEMLRQRTALLSHTSQQVLDLASVLGRRFTFTLLQALTGLAEPALLTVLKELIAAQLVIQESAEQFVFRHALTREAVYQKMLARECQRLHRAVAETIEATPKPQFAELAYHYYQAQVWGKTVEYGELAGAEAQEMYAPYAAIEQWSRVLNARQQLGQLLAQVYRSRGKAYEITGAFELARADYEQALALAQAAHDPIEEWHSLIALGFLWTGRDYALAGKHYQQALTVAQGINDGRLLAQCLNYLGNWHLNIEQPREALSAHQQALALFEQMHDEAGLAATYDLLGMTAMLGSDLLQATAYYQQAIARFRQLDHRQGLVSSLTTLMVLGGGGSSETETLVPNRISYAESLHYGEEALQIAREIGDRAAEVYALVALAQYLGPHGKYTRAFDVTQTSLALAEQIEHLQWQTAAHWQLGALYLDVLALPQAQQQFEQAFTLARRLGSWNWIRIISGFFARLRLLQGELAEAEALLTDALAANEPMHTIGQRIVWDARASLALARGRPELALATLDRLIISAANRADEQVIPHLWKSRGEALFAQGQKAEAETGLRAAYRSVQVEGLHPLRWRTALALAKLYRSQGRRIDADQMFTEARTTIQMLADALPDEALRRQFLTSTERMLPQRRPLTTSRAVSKAFAGLTAREREVATLIGQGYTNRAIADQLVLSERTVEGHVTAILTKLGCTTRTQIATWAADKGLTKSML